MILNLYFLAAVGLHLKGVIRLEPGLNLALMALALIPIPAARHRRPIAAVRAAVVLALSALLLWRESYLPPFGVVAEFLVNPDLRPTFAFAASFLSRYLSAPTLLAAAALAALGVAGRHRGLRLEIVSVAALLSAPLFGGWTAAGGLPGQAERFYADEARRTSPAPAGVNVDVVLIHVCSLAWEDLRAADLQDHPLFKRFDYLFTRFNSVSSYSTPAALRLLRAGCGQEPHGALYRDAASGCYLFDAFRARGYAPLVMFNHSGDYDGFGESLRKNGRAPAALGIEHLPVRQHAFNGEPVYDDGASLDKAWAARLASGAPRAFLYYNTMSLHDGSRPLGDESWPKGPRTPRYRKCLAGLLDDVSGFLDRLEASGHRVVVVFVPEHGAALLGDEFQAPGLRDLPLPRLTTVPVGIAVIDGRHAGSRRQVWIDAPSSYLALSASLSALLERAAQKAPLTLEPSKLPSTPFLSENESARVLASGGAYYLNAKKGEWRRLPSSEVPETHAR